MKNFLIVLSLIIFGWEASVPLTYFAAQGHFSFLFIFFAGIFGATVSDSVWYMIGRHITNDRLAKIKYFRKRPHHFHAISKAMKKNGYLFLFCSKFLYGIGIPVHILSGTNKLSYWKTVGVNILGDALWLIVVYAFATGAQAIPKLKQDLVVAQLGFGIFLIIMFSIHYFAGAYIKKYFHLDSEEEEDEN